MVQLKARDRIPTAMPAAEAPGDLELPVARRRWHPPGAWGDDPAGTALGLSR